MPVRLIESLATTAELAEVFSDESVLRAMLDFEVALARAEARSGVVPGTAAEAIAKAAQAETFDIAALAHDALRAGTLAIPLVKALTEKVRVTDSSAAGFVHWGATSQDVADSALVLLIKRAHTIFESDLTRLESCATDSRRKAQKYGDAGTNPDATCAANHLWIEGSWLARSGSPQQKASRFQF